MKWTLLALFLTGVGILIGVPFPDSLTTSETQYTFQLFAWSFGLTLIVMTPYIYWAKKIEK